MSAAPESSYGFSIQKVARRSGFSELTLRHYERIGLIEALKIRQTYAAAKANLWRARDAGDAAAEEAATSQLLKIVGSHMLQHLLNDGYEVRTTARAPGERLGCGSCLPHTAPTRDGSRSSKPT